MENLSAGQKLDRAFDRLGEEHSLSFELDLDTDAATLKGLDAADTAPEDRIPDEIAELISGGRISVSVESKKPLAESGEKDLKGFAMEVSGPDSTLLEYRMIGDYVYGRADFEQFGQLAGSSMPSVDLLSPGDELPKGAEDLEKFLNGDWVKISTKEFKEAGLFAGGPDTGGAPDSGRPADLPTFDASTQKKLLKAVGDVISNEVDFTTTDGEDGAERITATASLRTLATSLIDEVRPLAKEFPAGFELPTAKELKELPRKKGSADFTLKNGDLTEVSFDLTQLDKKLKGEKLGLVLRLGEGETPTAPSGATELNLEELQKAMMPELDTIPLDA
ncbi:hypothetical protein ACFVW2_15765 [Streptomyces sp. NPDC058171]